MSIKRTTLRIVIGAMLAHGPVTSVAADMLARSEGDVSFPAMVPTVVLRQVADWWDYWFRKDDYAAAILKIKFSEAWDQESQDLRALRSGESPAAYNARIDLEQAQFLCIWKDAHAPMGNPMPLDICNGQNPLVAELAAERAASEKRVAAVSHANATDILLLQVADWWGYWLQKDDYAAANLRIKFDKAWEHVSQELRAFRHGEDMAAYNARIDLEQAQFLCMWKDAHTPLGNPMPLDICNGPNPLVAELAAERAASEKRAEETAKTAKIAEAARRQAETERETELKEHAANFSSEDLCRYYSRGHAMLRGELVRRGALSPAEWSLVDQKKVQIGMSETALLCSWGEADVNRTVTAAGVHKQYVYSLHRFVYVDDGIVVAFQD